MEETISDGRRSLSDLRSNLETGLYSPPQAFDEKNGPAGLNPIKQLPEETSNIGENGGNMERRPVLAGKNSLNSSDKIVTGSRLI